MAGRDGLRPLKAWRYVGVFGPQLMACVCALRIGPARESFWAVWNRQSRQFREGRAGVALEPGHVRVRDGGVQLDLVLYEEPGVETVCGYEPSYAWTRKQGGIEASGAVNVDGALTAVRARAIVDDTAGYYPHHTSWRWSAGVGRTVDQRLVAWNLVEGINDPPRGSERTLWVEGEPREPAPVHFDEDLGAIGELRFHREAVLERRRNLLLVRSDYRQPFGTFSGLLPGAVELAEGYGVMEAHDVRW
jgi:ribosomal protein S6E (S10)